jgi:hypothetical protein
MAAFRALSLAALLSQTTSHPCVDTNGDIYHSVCCQHVAAICPTVHPVPSGERKPLTFLFNANENLYLDTKAARTQ